MNSSQVQIRLNLKSLKPFEFNALRVHGYTITRSTYKANSLSAFGTHDLETSIEVTSNEHMNFKSP